MTRLHAGRQDEFGVLLRCVPVNRVDRRPRTSSSRWDVSLLHETMKGVSKGRKWGQAQGSGTERDEARNASSFVAGVAGPRDAAKSVDSPLNQTQPVFVGSDRADEGLIILYRQRVSLDVAGLVVAVAYEDEPLSAYL